MPDDPGPEEATDQPAAEPTAVPEPPQPPEPAGASSDVGQEAAARQVQGKEAVPARSDADLRAFRRSTTRQRINFRKIYGRVLLGALIVQLLVGDAVFIAYAVGNAWHIPAEAIIAWLTATVVQVVGLVYVIVRYLFSAEGDP